MFNKIYDVLDFSNINEFFSSLVEDNFQDRSTLWEIKDKLQYFHRKFNNEVIEYTDIKKKTYVYNGNLTLSGDTIVFDTLIVTGNLTIFGNNLIIKKKLIVGGNANLHLDENISNTEEKRKIWCNNPKTIILICGELKRLTKEKVKESNIEFFGDTILTVFENIYIQGTLNISGNCYFHSDVEINKDLIAHTLMLTKCEIFCVDGRILLKNNLRINGNVRINLSMNNFCKIY